MSIKIGKNFQAKTEDQTFIGAVHNTGGKVLGLSGRQIEALQIMHIKSSVC